jgi:DNA-binding transcriptional MerR regulator
VLGSAPTDTLSCVGTREADMTIEQLAAATGMTVRNIRSHRTSGLLPPPEVRNSIGYYGAEHVARLQLIQELQAEGFNLQAIKRLIDATHAPRSVLGFRHVLFAPVDAQPSAIMPFEELLEMFGSARVTGELVTKAIEVGELIPLEDGRVEVAHPVLLEAVRLLADQGVPVEPLFGIFELVRGNARAVAGAFADMVLEQLWKPFQQAGFPEERWDELGEAIRRLKPIASQVVLAAFQTELANEIEARFGEELSRLTGERGGGAEPG